MRRLLSLSITMLLAFVSIAQTQQGIVKTKGRMVNGQLVPGKGLSGATIQVQGRTAVLSQTSGSFSFPIPGQTFMVQSVTKNGYQLVDAEAAPKSYSYSTNPLYLLMEPPEQQLQDKLDAERKIRRTLQKQLQKREDEIEAMNATLEEKQQLLQKLYADQENNERLIADMAKEYAQIDYDQMDALNRRISDAIINGRLKEADSLLRSKGDMRSRIAEIKKEQQLEIEEEEKLTQRKNELGISKEGTRKKMEDIALDCSRRAELFKIDYKLDSVAYYFELRAELDTINASWQFDAAYNLQQIGAQSIQKYYNRVISLTQDNLIGNNLFLYSTAANNLGAYYSAINNYQSAALYYKIGIQGRKKYAEQSTNPNNWNHVAWSLVSLSDLYIKTKHFKESAECLKEASDIYERIRPTFYDGNIYSYARLYTDWGWFYLQSENWEQSFSWYSKAWNSYKIAYQKDPNPFNYYSLVELRKVLIHFTTLFNILHRENEIESFFLELKGLFEESVPCYLKEIDYEYASLITYWTFLYSESQRFKEAEEMIKQALEIYMRLAKDNPQAYEPYVAGTLGSLSFNSIFLKKYTQSEQYAREGLAVDSTKHFIYTNLAASLLFQGKYAEAEAIYRQYKDELKDSFLDDFRQFGEAGVIPKEREEDVEKIKRLLNE